MNTYEARRRGKGTGVVQVAVVAAAYEAPDGDGKTALFGDDLDVADLPHAEAIEWLVARGCGRSEGTRIVVQAGASLLGQSTGAVPTTAEWELDQPVTRPNRG